MAKIRVLHITPSYKPAWIYGGPTVSVSRLCESQVQADAEVEVFTTTANGKEELNLTTGRAQHVDGVTVTYFSRWTGDHTHFSPALLWRTFCYAPAYDAVHIHAWWNLVSVLAALMCWLRGVKPVVSPRGMLSDYGQQSGNQFSKRILHTFLGRFLLSRSILHATAQQEVKEGQAIIPDWQHFVAPNIIALPTEINKRAAPSGVENPLKLLFLSRIDPKKGLELTFEALAQTTFAWELCIAGKGQPAYLSDLERKADQLGISHHIKWVGWADQKQKYALLAQSDLFVLTSYNENFANAVLESLALGIPVLISEQVGLSEYVRAADLGWITQLDLASITQTLEAAFIDVNKRKTIYQQAPIKVREDFQAIKVAKQYLQAYTAFSN